MSGTPILPAGSGPAEAQDVLEPTAVHRPGHNPSSESAPAPGPLAEAHQAPAPAPPPEPLVFSIGAIAGLSPRRERGDRGEVPGADVDLIDGLDRPTWNVVAGWLQHSTSVSTRHTRLQVLAAFLRWLRTLTPPVALLDVTEDHLIAYRDAAATGALTVGVRKPGKALGPATVAKQRHNLSSFYGYARRRKVIAYNPTADVDAPPVSTEGSTRAFTPVQHRHMRAGVAKLAATGQLAQAAAIALLDDVGGRVGLLAGLTVGDIRTVTESDGSRHTVVRFRNKGGKYAQLPIPDADTIAMLQQLRQGKHADDLLFTREDGWPIDRWWVTAALKAAAAAGQMPTEEGEKAHPHRIRATVITELLDGGAPPEQVQQAVQHKSISTTFRYKGRNKRLSGHVLYRGTRDSEATGDG
ncbi:tyrosine-type recombinase/integrase [Nonomuraea sp. NPDC001831]|uniref:tyrosine-type recombinase/integrase n=1 Tax=Nonomuraea sp. NPDC001831 TaxID=3364340 RepID=UPI00368523F1